MRIVVTIIGILLGSSITIASAQSNKADASTIRSLINDIENIQAEIDTLKIKFLDSTNGLIPKLEKYVADAKECGRKGSLHYNGTQCIQGTGTIQKVELKGSMVYSQTCTEDLVLRSSGQFDRSGLGGVGSTQGSNYIFCTK